MLDHLSGGDPAARVHRISVVIPVYAGEASLPSLVDEIIPFTDQRTTEDGHRYLVTEVIAVWDWGRDRSDVTIRALAQQYPDLVKPVWLARNYGQHAATMAGMASAGGDWIVTMDEDHQHDAKAIPRLLDVALRDGAGVVYAAPDNPPPHGWFRNATSKLSKRLISWLVGNDSATDFHSYRLVLGETGRALAAYAGPGVYLDVALSWLVPRSRTCPVSMRGEARPSGYNLRSLGGHFLRMLITSGTRGLRLVTFTGLALGAIGIILSVILAISSLISPAPVQGWASLICVVLIGFGLTLGSIGIVAEYLGVTVSSALGKPLYLIVSDPEAGPLGSRRTRHNQSQT